MAQRILQGAPATLTFYNLDADGTATAAVGTMTVGVTQADGTVVIAAGTATTFTAPGTYTVPVTATQTASLNLLTATWTDSGASSRTTQHEIVGGYVFSLNDVRTFPNLSSNVTYPDAMVIARRSEVEDELEQMRSAAFVPRYARLVLNGTGAHDVASGLSWLRTLRTARIYSQAGSTSYTSLTAAQLAACVLTEDGQILRGDGDVWPWGIGNIIVEVEHGFTDWGNDLRRAALTRLREVMNADKSGIPDRATSFVNVDGSSITLASANATMTGNPLVDAVYSRYPRLADGNQPASGLLSFSPQWTGVFRGSRL